MAFRVAALVLFLVPSCAVVDLTVRPVWRLLPACLLVSSTYWSWQPDHVREAAQEWNARLDREVLRLPPDCEAGDEFVPVSFVRGMPPECAGALGCTHSMLIVRGVPTLREVLIQEDAPYRTVVHELGHLVGCHNRDRDFPCLMGLPP